MDVYTLPPPATAPVHLQPARACRTACAKSLRAALEQPPGALRHCFHTLVHARPACDRIDISWMEHNVADRHNFFTKNFWMVSDIREIVVSGKRARLRVQRLVARGGNVFSFIAAPPQVS
jgi:hypothetical protein